MRHFARCFQNFRSTEIGGLPLISTFFYIKLQIFTNYYNRVILVDVPTDIV